MNKPKTKPIKKAKKDAWDMFSIYIRTRDCLETTGTTTEGACVTCGKIYPFKKLQAGHWLQGRHNSILFDERHCHAQCYHCNIGLKSNPVKYYHFMEKKHGLKIMAELEELDKQIRPFKAFELMELEETFKKKIEALTN